MNKSEFTFKCKLSKSKLHVKVITFTCKIESHGKVIYFLF